MKLKKTLSLLLLISFFSIISCEDNNFIIETHPTHHNVVLNVNENVTEEVSFSISYNKLIENSLCPEGAVCVWEGRVIVELTIDVNTTILLGMGNLINTSAVKVFVYNNYSIKIIHVDTDGTITLKIEPSN